MTLLPNRADDVTVAFPLFQAERGGSIPTSALDLHVERIPRRLARELNSLWHSTLPDTHLGNISGSKYAICFGASFSGKWFATAIWTHPVAANRMSNADGSIELRRFAISPEAPPNTASRMLRVMVLLLKRRWPELTRCISYQSKEHHHGTIYKAAGWKPAAETPFKPWLDRADSTRAPSQIQSDKVRWERELA